MEYPSREAPNQVAVNGNGSHKKDLPHKPDSPEATAGEHQLPTVTSHRHTHTHSNQGWPELRAAHMLQPALRTEGDHLAKCAYSEGVSLCPQWWLRAHGFELSPQLVLLCGEVMETLGLT